MQLFCELPQRLRYVLPRSAAERLHTIKGNAIVLNISKAALFAAVISLSAAPAVFAQDASSSSAEASAPAASQPSFSTSLTIPTVTAVDSSMDEGTLRQVLSGNVAAHASELAALSATSITVPEITLTITTSDSRGAQEVNVATYKDLVLNNVKNGVAESASVGSAVSKGPEGTFTFGRMSTGLLDIGGIMALYAMVPGTGTEAPLKPIYRNFTWDGAKFETDEVSCDIGKIATDEFDARPLKVSFQELTDAANQLEAAKDGPPPAGAMGRVVSFLTDIFQAFKSTPTTIGAIDCSGQGKDGKPFTLALGGVQIDGFSPGSYPALTINDLKIGASDGSVGLKSATFKSIDFSQPLAALKAANGVDPEWFDKNWRQIIPAWGGMALSGLAIDVPDPEQAGGRVQLNVADFDLTLSDYLNGIPTKVSSSAHGVDMPLPPDSEDDTAKMLKAIGITKINANYEFSASWDKAGQAIRIDNISVSGADLGSFALAAVVGNATEQLFAVDPDLQQAASMGVTVKSITLTIRDDGLGDKLVPLLAAEQNADPATFRTQMAGVAEGAALQMLGSTDQARALGAAVGDFMSGKTKSVRIDITAKDPNGISVPQLMQASDDPTVLASAVDITGSSPN
jgi:hypothetical protein